MKDSNQFHAVALDTYPPAVYMNDVSHAIVDLVHCFNKVAGEMKVLHFPIKEIHCNSLYLFLNFNF